MFDKPTKNKLAPKKTSTISEMEQSLNALNDEYRSLEKQDAEFQTAPEYTALMDAISEGREQKRSLLDKPEALAQALDAYSAWQEESGYSDVIHRMEELRGEMKTLRGLWRGRDLVFADDGQRQRLCRPLSVRKRQRHRLHRQQRQCHRQRQTGR